MSLVTQNLLRAGEAILGCNMIGYAITAACETHKITDLVGTGSFLVVAMMLLSQDRQLLTPRGTISCGIVLVWGARLGNYLL